MLHIHERQLTSDFEIVNTTKKGSTKETGYFRIVEQALVTNMDTGFTDQVNTSCLKLGILPEIQKLANIWKKNGISGKVQVLEKLESDLTPGDIRDEFNKGGAFQPKIAGETGIPCTLLGEAIYRCTRWAPSEKYEDAFVAHDNGDAIRVANADIKKQADDSDATEF